MVLVYFLNTNVWSNMKKLLRILHSLPPQMHAESAGIRSVYPKILPRFETKESNTLVNTEAMKDPWDYRLKVWADLPMTRKWLLIWLKHLTTLSGFICKNV